MPNWTDEQKQAIEEKGSNLLVAAAAGSGKTAVLVERIINKIINENIDIDKLLVVTFTNAAASEMRERVLDALYKKIEQEPDNVFIQRQVNLLNKANICTIHSFCLEVIRNYFYELDISANFRIAETTEIELLKQEIIEDLFEEKYIQKDENFLKLINTYTSYRGDEKLKELILKIYKFIQSAPFPAKWLEEKVNEFNLKDKLDVDFEKTIWGKIICDEAVEKLEENKLKLKALARDLKKYEDLKPCVDMVNFDVQQMQEIEDKIQNDIENKWDIIYEIANTLKFGTWPSVKKCLEDDYRKEVGKTRYGINENTKKYLSRIFAYNSKEANEDIYSMYEILNSIKNLIFEFDKNFKQNKKEKNIIDFNDIEHYALEILLKEDENGNFMPTEVANKIKEQFVEIAVDEYQDSNLVQEYILNSISTGKNKFMVGDVKQSIYKFRQARPKLFLEKYEKYDLVSKQDNDIEYKPDSKRSTNLEDKENVKGKKIQLFKNFRSRENVLDLTNTIFEQIMSKKLGDIDYNEDEYLNLGADYKHPEKSEKVNYAGKAQLHIIDLEKTQEEIEMWKSEENEEQEEQIEPIENIMLEAKFVTKQIKELIDSNYMVFDKKLNNYRNVTYKDIVILLRTTKDIAPVFEKNLTENDVPVFSDTSSNALDSTEIQTIMDLLRIINNPLQDIPLITVLRSSIGNFTDNDLVEIRLADRNEKFYNAMLKARVQVKDELKDKINIFINKLEKWKKDQEIFTLDELIWNIYMDSNYYNYVGLLVNGSLRQANLRMLFEKAKQYETASFKGLYNFINFIDKLALSSNDMQSARIIGENDNVVRIMSIHKSKGLEFPVVFLCNSNKNFNFMDLNDSILLHQDYGFGPKYINYERRIEYNTLAKEALRIKQRNEIISEEMRILYVALTRAKEKLFIIGVSKDLKKDIKQKEELLNMYNEEKVNTNLLKKYTTYLDWIELVYLNNKEMKNIIELNKHSYKEISIEKEKLDEDEILNKFNKKVKENDNKEEIEEISKKLNWNYDFELSKNIPTKTSVSKIKEEKNKENDLKGFLKVEIEDDNDINHEENDTQIEDNNIDLHTLKEPSFMKDEVITSAKKGTIVHLILQKLDEKKEYSFDSIKELIQDLVLRKIITEKEADRINVKSILDFTKSELFKSLKDAKKIYREQPFYINIPAKEIYNIDVDEMVLVQGVIDLFYINKDDECVLVDYKTDFAEDEKELVEKYKQQLKLYKDAIEKGLNRKVDKVLIYSIYLQKEISL